MPRFKVTAMDAGQVDLAYPLIRAAVPGVDLDAWRGFAAERLADGGVLALTVGATLTGVLTFRPFRDLRHGRVLLVDNLVTFELSRSAPGRQALMRAVERLAKRRGYRVLHVAARLRENEAAWATLGCEPETTLLCKRLPAARARATTRRAVAH